MSQLQLVFKPSYEVVDLFFDRERVQRLVEKEEYKPLYKIGGKVRDATRRLIKVKEPTKLQIAKLYRGTRAERRKAAARIKEKMTRHSKPGEPPLARSRGSKGDKGIRTILFSLDEARLMVIVGPVKFTNKRVPEILQFGGETETWVKAKPGRDGRPRWKRGRAHIAPRPYMDKGLEKAAKKFPKLFEGILPDRAF